MGAVTEDHVCIHYRDAEVLKLPLSTFRTFLELALKLRQLPATELKSCRSSIVEARERNPWIEFKRIWKKLEIPSSGFMKPDQGTQLPESSAWERYKEENEAEWRDLKHMEQWLVDNASIYIAKGVSSKGNRVPKNKGHRLNKVVGGKTQV